MAAWLLVGALIADPARAEPLTVTWAEPVEVAAGGGYRGPWRMNRSVYDYVDDPAVAIDEQGFVGVVWVDQSQKDVFFQVYAPDGQTRLAAPVNVSRSPEIFSWLPRVVVAPGDTREVFILWQEIVFSGGSHGGETFFARSTDGGRTFGAPRNLSNSLAGDGKGRITPRIWHNGSLDIAMAPTGELYAAWTEYEGLLWFSRSADRGATFSDPLHIAGGGDALPARAPALALDDAGTVYLAWTVGDDPAADIRLAQSVDHGRSFAAPQIIDDSGGYADSPKLAVDGQGTVHLIYAESPDGPFARSQIRYVRLNDGVPAPPRVISGGSPERFDNAGFPALGLDGADNLYVLWELFPRQGRYPRGLGFTGSTDGGQSFSAPSVIPRTANPSLGVNGSQQGLLMRKLAVNRAGALAVVNSTFKRGETSRIWLIRGQAPLH